MRSERTRARARGRSSVVNGMAEMIPNSMATLTTTRTAIAGSNCSETAESTRSADRGDSQPEGE